MIFGEMTKLSKGIYKITFINTKTGEVAKCLSAGNVTFFLNKEGSDSSIKPGDTYQIVPIINGTATVNFKNATFKPNQNVLIALGPGYGVISQTNTSTRPCAYYTIPDSDIPSNDTKASDLILQNTSVYYGGKLSYLLKDNNGIAIANATISITINGKTYNKTTDKDGIAYITIRLISNKQYNITATYAGNDDCKGATLNSTVTVIPTITAEDVEKIFRNNTQYYPKVTDSSGNVLKDTKVTMNINGVFYTRITNDKGIATLNINLNPGKYIITAMYKNCFVSNSITVLPIVTTADLTKYFGIPDSLNSKLVDGKGNPIANQNLTYNINGVFYNRTTDINGIAKLNINLNPGEYIATVNYKSAFTSAKVVVLNPQVVKENATNSEIQNIINSIDNKGAVKFLGKVYNDISLDITKSMILTSDVNTTLNGKLNTYVLNLSLIHI